MNSRPLLRLRAPLAAAGSRSLTFPLLRVESPLREKSQKVERVTAALDALEGRSVPQWLEMDKDEKVGTVKQLPVREDITLPIDEQLIVELYSR